MPYLVHFTVFLLPYDPRFLPQIEPRGCIRKNLKYSPGRALLGAIYGKLRYLGDILVSWTVFWQVLEDSTKFFKIV